MAEPHPRSRHRWPYLAGIAVAIVGGLLWVAQDQETLRVQSPVSVSDPRFPDYLAALVGAPVNDGDAYTVLRNGDEALPAMLDAIQGAKSTQQTGARSIVLWSNPTGGASNIKLLYLLAIGGARKTIDIHSPYVTLDASTRWSLTTPAAAACASGSSARARSPTPCPSSMRFVTSFSVFSTTARRSPSSSRR